MPDNAKTRFAHRWPEDKDEEPVCVVTIEYTFVNRRVEATAVIIRMVRQNPMTTTIMRKLPLGAWMAEDRNKQLRTKYHPWLLAIEGHPARRHKMAVERSTAGRPVVTYELLEEVARVYKKAHATGNAPTKAVQNHFRRPRSTVSKWIRAARDEGLLGETEERRAGEQRPNRKMKKR